MADQSIGKATIVNGTVKALSSDGVDRVLQPNSPVFLNDRINTGAEGAISIVFNDAGNTQLDLGRMTEMVIDDSVLAAEKVDLEEVAAEIDAIQEALESGDEIQVAETAAGPTAGISGAGGGRPLYKDEIDGKEGEVTSGAETEGVASVFSGTLLDPVAEPDEPVAVQVAQLATPAPVVPEPEPIPIPIPISEPDDDTDPELFPPVDYDVAVEADFFQELPFSFAEGLGDDVGEGMPSDGSQMALMTAGTASQAALEDFFNVAPGVMDTLGNGNATDGSGIKTTIDVVAGDTISFDWFFDSAESSLFYNDFGFVVQEGTVVELSDVVSVGGSGATNWATYNFTATSTGVLEIGFGAMNSGDTAVDSQLLIDNLSINNVAVESFESGDFTGWTTIGNVTTVESHDEGGGTGSGEGINFGAGYLYEFQVGEAEIVADNIHGTDIEDGVTTQFTITGLPTSDGGEEQGLLLIDRGDDNVIEEIYGDGFGGFPAAGLDVQTGDSVYYFLEQGSFEVLPESVSFEYFTTDSDVLVSDGALITVSFEDIPEALPGEIAVDEDGLDGGNPGTVYTDGSDLAGENSDATGNLNYDFGDNGPHADTPFTWSNAGLPAVTSAGAAVTFDVIADGLQLVGHTGNVGDPVLALSLVDLASGEYDLEVFKPLDHDTPNTEDDIVLNFGYTVKDGDGDESSSVLSATVDDDSPELTGAFQAHQVEEEGLDNFDQDHDVDGDSIEGSTGNEDITGDVEFGGPGLVTATGDLSAMVSGGADEPLTFGFVDDAGAALESANSGLTSQGEELNYNVDGNVLTATSADGRAIFTVEITDASTGAYEFTLIDQLDHQAPLPGAAVENSLTLNLGAALQAVDSDGDAVSFGAIDTGEGAIDGLQVAVADDIPIAAPLENESIPQNMNLLLILDNSGSMDAENRIGDLNDAMDDLFAGIGDNTYLAGAENVRVHVVSYNTIATTVGTFDVKVGGVDQSVGWGDIEAAGWTNYEDGMFEALQWIHEDWPTDLDPDQDGVSPDNLPPLAMPGTVNKVVFISDGLPNTVNAGSGDDANPIPGGVSAAQALAHVTGAAAGTDVISELDALKEWADGGIEAVGIELDDLVLNEQEVAYFVLNEISSNGSAINVELPANLGPILGSLLPVDVPAPIISATVEEDDLDSNLDATDDLDATVPTDDSADGFNEDLSTDADEADDVLSGNLSELFMSGADENLTFSLNPTGDLPTLYSGGQEVSYDFSTPGILVASAGDTTVFTFEVGGTDGTWKFDLDGVLDHVPGDDENLELQTDGESVNGIDLSSIILATDADGDSVPATPGGIVIQVEDDAPVAEGEIGYAFGYSSYTNVGGEDIQGIPPSVEFDVLNNDEYGSDGPENGAPQVSVVNQNGAGNVSLNGNKIVFEPTLDWTGQTEITYEITDGDGDTSQATLTVVENKLIVGQNEDDVDPGINDFPYVVGEGADGQKFGTIDGGAGNDILIGDYGGSNTGTTTVNHNIVLVLDNSGSMWYESNSIPFDANDDGVVDAGESTLRIDGLKLATVKALQTLAASEATEVRVHLVEFNTDGAALGTFDLKTPGQLELAEAAVNGMTQPTGNDEFTNYEAGLQLAEAYVTSGDALDDTGVMSLVNQTVFISDGAPNRHNLGESDTQVTSDGNSEDDLKHIFGVDTDGENADQWPSGVVNQPDNDEDSEYQVLADWGAVDAIGINVDSNAKDILDRVENNNVDADGADNITLVDDLLGVLKDVTTVDFDELSAVGDDTIIGGEGDDLIYGDALFTDGVVANLIADGTILSGDDPGLDPGAGWAIFEALEGDSGIEWTRTDTINYILEHQAELAEESTIVVDNEPVGREGGDDNIVADEGDDIVFGQEGDDDISGGEDNDLLVGGSGEDDIDGDAGNDLLVGDALEIVPDDSIGSPDADDYLEVDVIDDGETDNLEGGADEDVIVDDALPSNEIIQPDPADEVIAEGDTAEVGGEEIDPLILLIPEDPGTV